MSQVSNTSTPSYRAEIDGLRAIAVLAVVLFHFELPGLGGGFVGVDVFFVISGFLIGGILWREFESTGQLSLIRFYTRRLKRLAPAYFAMVLAVWLISYFVLLPFEFREFGKSLIAATVYLSNVLFYQGTGYFDIGAESKVLLHTWSLAVEEQFYIFLPLLILLLKFNRAVLLTSLGAIFLASLAACVLITPQSQPAAFYLFPFRAWELLAGVLLAVSGHIFGARWRIHSVLSWLGLACIVYAVVFTAPGKSFPGSAAIPPVLGSVLIIANGRHDNLVNRALSSPVPVFIGLISYSLYLWHWPVLILSRYWQNGYSGPVETTGWLVVAVLVSVCSWRFVERPIRTAPLLKAPAVFGGAVLASVLAIAAGAYGYLKNGAPERFAAHIRPHIAASADFLQDWSRCETKDAGIFAGVETCPIGPDGPAQVLIWGDSHVRAFKEGLDRAAWEADVPGLLIWHAGCPPLFGLEKTETAATPAQDANCTRTVAQIRTAFSQLGGIRRILLIGRWSYYAEGAGTGLDAHNRISLRGAADIPQIALFSQAVSTTITELGQSFPEIFVLRQVPEIPRYDSRKIARALAHGHLGAQDRDIFNVSLAEVETRVRRAEAAFAPLATKGDIQVIDPWPEFCTNGQCSAVKPGRALFFDNNHITNDASLAIRHLFVPFLTGQTAK